MAHLLHAFGSASPSGFLSDDVVEPVQSSATDLLDALSEGTRQISERIHLPKAHVEAEVSSTPLLVMGAAGLGLLGFIAYNARKSHA